MTKQKREQIKKAKRAAKRNAVSKKVNPIGQLGAHAMAEVSDAWNRFLTSGDDSRMRDVWAKWGKGNGLWENKIDLSRGFIKSVNKLNNHVSYVDIICATIIGRDLNFICKFDKAAGLAQFMIRTSIGEMEDEYTLDVSANFDSQHGGWDDERFVRIFSALVMFTLMVMNYEIDGGWVGRHPAYYMRFLKNAVGQPDAMYPNGFLDKVRKLLQEEPDESDTYPIDEVNQKLMEM